MHGRKNLKVCWLIFYVNLWGKIFEKIINKVRGYFCKYYVRGLFNYHHVNCDFSSMEVNGFPRISLKGSNNVHIGKDFRINSYPYGIGNFKGCRISVSEKGYLSIGNYSGISNVVLHCLMKIIIGNHVNIGDGTMIVDTDFHSIFWQDKLKGQDVENAKCSSINIGDLVFIGARSIIFKRSYNWDESCNRCR